MVSNPFEKYESKWIISPNRDENRKYLKPPPWFPCGDWRIFWGNKLTTSWSGSWSSKNGPKVRPASWKSKKTLNEPTTSFTIVGGWTSTHPQKICEPSKWIGSWNPQFLGGWKFKKSLSCQHTRSFNVVNFDDFDGLYLDETFGKCHLKKKTHREGASNMPFL